MAKTINRQPYPRKADSPLAKSELFPKMNPPIPRPALQKAIENAFLRTKKTKTGESRKIPDNPEKLVKLCLKHLKERTDPIIGTSFYTQLSIDELFDMDAIPHEMQRLRMRIGEYYQFLLVELMRVAKENGNSSIIQVFDGLQEGDVFADIKPPNFDRNLRLYISVKKSSDTVGGQDFGDAVKRLEKVAKADKNLSFPYLCVVAIGTPDKGKILSYEESRTIRYNKDGHPYSENCELWMPGFIFPYVTGLSAIEIYKESLNYIDTHMPFYSLKFREECTESVKEAFVKLGISDNTGIINKEEFFKLVAHEN